MVCEVEKKDDQTYQEKYQERIEIKIEMSPKKVLGKKSKKRKKAKNFQSQNKEKMILRKYQILMVFEIVYLNILCTIL